MKIKNIFGDFADPLHHQGRKKKGGVNGYFIRREWNTTQWINRLLLQKKHARNTGITNTSYINPQPFCNLPVKVIDV